MKCKQQIREAGRWPRYYQCSRNATKDGYCWQHHPDTVREKQEERSREYRESLEKRNARHAAARKLTELEAGIERLVKRWRKRAEGGSTNKQTWDYNRATDECADELEALALLSGVGDG